MVREGATRADIAAEFRPGPAVARWLVDNELTGDDAGLLLLRRTIDANGRSRAFVNGAAVTLAQLRELGEQLVDVHGQHAHQSLLRPAAQLELLDEHGALGEAPCRSRCGACGVEARAARTRASRVDGRQRDRRTGTPALARARNSTRSRREAGEWERVEAEHKRLSHAASLLEGAARAVDALSDADDCGADPGRGGQQPSDAARDLRRATEAGRSN